MTLAELSARVDAIEAAVNELRLFRHRAQWPEGHPEDPGFRRLDTRESARRRQDGATSDRRATP